MTPGFLYLPMEIFVREFDSRLLIALMAVERGMEVVIGQKWLMEKNIAAVPRGLWIFKTMTLRDSKRMMKAKAAGHLVASIDEEVPALSEGSGDLLWVSQAAAEACDTIFCLGEEHAKSLRLKWPDVTPKLRLTGNPRWDYLRPELRAIYEETAARYRAQHGRIILINTNSGNFNPAKKKPEEVYRDYVRDNKLDPSDEKQMSFWKDYWAFEEANFHGAIRVARQLSAKHPGHTIILRPHPSERLSTYAGQLAGLANVKVLFEGSAAPWILAADVLIHTDCTTGIEAFALGKPSVCYETIPSVLHDQLLSGRLSHTVQSDEAVCAEVARIIADTTGSLPPPAAMQETFRRFFTAQDGPLAAERVVEAAQAALGCDGQSPLQPLHARWRPEWNYVSRWPTTQFRRKMFPPYDIAAVRARVATLAKLLGHSHPPQLVSCGDSVLHVFRHGLEPPRHGGNIIRRSFRRITGL